MVEESLFDTSADWFSLTWFDPSTLRNFEWENPIYLQLLWIVPLILLIKWFISRLRNNALSLSLPKKSFKQDWLTLLRWVPASMLAATVALLIIALARPQKTNERVDRWTEGIDIMLVADISESMLIEDFRPNRLEAAKSTALDFISGRFQDRIGIVVFSGDAFSLAPLTTDYKLLKDLIETIDYRMIDNRGTAIGSALAVATNRMRESDSKSKVMILLSDGDNTAGNIEPIVAAELAAAYNIKIYTIAIGKEGRVPFGTDIFGRQQFIENSLDETTLRKIAQIGGGQFYRASNNTALQKIFDEIDAFEKVEIKESRYKDTKDFYRYYLYWSALFLGLYLLLRASFLNNFLID
ncbi:vWA domain-containing protein [Penaeicola halotolerans]|uniref:vWA domain-containing protein n=1 Tax=Penaeicola halotolerans TaxID=2793196 RepID=UPI001CF8AD0C|nr:VWA domain-containing protein [Penaeicola halotolerans]